MGEKYFIHLSCIHLSRSLEDITDAVKCFKDACGVSCIRDLKIDTMSCVINRRTQVENFPDGIFIRKYHKRFPAVTIKHKKTRISGNIFPKCVVLMGLKSLAQTDLFMKYIN